MKGYYYYYFLYSFRLSTQEKVRRLGRHYVREKVKICLKVGIAGESTQKYTSNNPDVRCKAEYHEELKH